MVRQPLGLFRLFVLLGGTAGMCGLAQARR